MISLPAAAAPQQSEANAVSAVFSRRASASGLLPSDFAHLAPLVVAHHARVIYMLEGMTFPFPTGREPIRSRP